MPKELTIQQRERLEPMARVLAANGIAQSLAFTMERRYLNDILRPDYPMSLELVTRHTSYPSTPFWIRITQVGRPIEDGAEKCFTAIQKILTACFLPHETKLIFLVSGKDGKYEMYLGLRSLRNKDKINKSFMGMMNDFIKGVWPGMKCENISSQQIEEVMREDIVNNYGGITAITGIPSMESQYETLYPATIDMLLAGMQKKNFTYMVIADPVETTDIDNILYQVREFNGQAESLKSFNFSENMSESLSKTQSDTESMSESESKTDKSKTAKIVTGATAAISLAAAFFKPATSIAAMSLPMVVNQMFPSYTTGTTRTKSTTQSTTHSATQGKAISSNIVNKQIEAVSEHLDYHAKRYEAGKAQGCWQVGVYVLSEKQRDAQVAAMQLKSIVSGQESIYEPIRIHAIEDLMKDDVLPQTLGSMAVPSFRVKTDDGQRFNHPLGTHFNDLTTLLTTKELSYFINFPLHSVPGISVIDSLPDFSLNEQEIDSSEPTISLGKMLNGGSPTTIDYKIPISLLSRHTLLSGINGMGKTNTVQAILNGIGDVPFLVIEPAKTEYVDWAIEYNKTHTDNPIEIYIPGCKTYKGDFVPNTLHLNPFEIVWLNEKQEPNALAHIDRLKSTFAAAFPMYDILPVLMEDLIYTIYQDKTSDWLNNKPTFGKTRFPSLYGMSVNVEKVIHQCGYEQRVESNMKACLNTRINSLMRGWRGQVLNILNSTKWNELFGKPCVINLSYVGDDIDKCFFMALILQFLYEYRTAQAEVGEVDFNANTCQHLTVIEEAHRVMSKCENPELPQYKSAMMFSNMLSEIRAYGEGMLLVDQVPTRLIPDAIKNTNLKITHRLVAEDDSRAIGEAMGLSDEQRRVLSKLLTGQCIINSSLSTDTNWVQINKVK